MPTTVRLKRSTTPGNAPTSLLEGEIAINLVDYRIFAGNSTAVWDALQTSDGNLHLTNAASVLTVGNSTVNVVINSSSFVSRGSSFVCNASNNATLTVPNTLSIVCNTVNSSILYTGQQNFLIANLTSTSNSIAWNLATAQVARHTGTENTTLAAPSNGVEGGTYIFIFKQHATAPVTLGFNAAYHFANGTPTASATNNAVDIMSCVYEGGVMRCVYQNGVT